MSEVPPDVLLAYGLGGALPVPILGGLINPTYRVDVAGIPRCVLQRLHPIFAPEVNLDINAITEHITKHGLTTPRVMATLKGTLWVTSGGNTWRALTFIPGVTVHHLTKTTQAESAGQLVGRFHQAVADLSHTFAFARAGVHDTPAHLERLRAAMQIGGSTPIEGSARTLGQKILDTAGTLPVAAPHPQRICHGDLKISNIRFAEDNVNALCLIDLDTLGFMTLAYEIGDALRSWCNLQGEDVPDPEIDLPICRAALGGYVEKFGFSLSQEERLSIANGLETVCVELAARFCRDVFEDAYWGWDANRYESRRHHNLVRAQGQFALGLSARRQREQIRALLD